MNKHSTARSANTKRKTRTTPKPEAAQPPPAPSRLPTVGDLYSDALERALGQKPGERNIDEPFRPLSPGEMLRWTLGGCIYDARLDCALRGVATEIERAIGDKDLTEGNLYETVIGSVMRLRVIAELHRQVLEQPAPRAEGVRS